MDDELQAMQLAAAAISPLDVEARARVLRWLAERYGGGAASAFAQATPRTINISSGDEFADFFSKFSPSTDKERALAGAYWLRLQGNLQFQSIEVNTMLKDLGHGVSNITDAISAGMREKPALMIQIKKSGTARQSRKLYKVTDAGVRLIENRVNAGSQK